MINTFRTCLTQSATAIRLVQSIRAVATAKLIPSTVSSPAAAIVGATSPSRAAISARTAFTICARIATRAVFVSAAFRWSLHSVRELFFLDYYGEALGVHLICFPLGLPMDYNYVPHDGEGGGVGNVLVDTLPFHGRQHHLLSLGQACRWDFP